MAKKKRPAAKKKQPTKPADADLPEIVKRFFADNPLRSDARFPWQDADPRPEIWRTLRTMTRQASGDKPGIEDYVLAQQADLVHHYQARLVSVWNELQKAELEVAEHEALQMFDSGDAVGVVSGEHRQALAAALANRIRMMAAMEAAPVVLASAINAHNTDGFEVAKARMKAEREAAEAKMAGSVGGRIRAKNAQGRWLLYARYYWEEFDKKRDDGKNRTNMKISEDAAKRLKADKEISVGWQAVSRAAKRYPRSKEKF